MRNSRVTKIKRPHVPKYGQDVPREYVETLIDTATPEADLYDALQQFAHQKDHPLQAKFATITDVIHPGRLDGKCAHIRRDSRGYAILTNQHRGHRVILAVNGQADAPDKHWLALCYRDKVLMVLLTRGDVNPLRELFVELTGRRP